MKLKKWQKAGLIWALWMFIILTFVWPYFNEEKITLQKTLIAIPIWIIGGLFVGYFNEKRKKAKL